jgi:hypothetical protein
MFKISASLPSFWPARVPNQVLSETDYLRVLDTTLPLAQRQAAWVTRRDWFRGFPVAEDIVDMVTDFHKLGVIEERPGAADGAPWPAKMFVESKPDFPVAQANAGAPATARSESAFVRAGRRLRTGGRSRLG